MRKRKTIEKLKVTFGHLKDDDFRFDMIEKYFLNKDNTEAFQVISEKTCNDLDFEDLFMFLDRTTSKVGQQCLYNKLRAIPKDSSDNEKKEKLLELLSTDNDLRTNTQQLLEKLNKTEVYYIASLFQEEHQKAPKWFFIVKIMAVISLSSLLLIPFIPQMFFVFLLAFLGNFGIHYWNKRNLYKYLGSIPQLLRLSTIATTLFKVQPFQDVGQGVSDSLKVIKQVRNRMSFFRLEANIQSESQALFWGILELFKTAFLLEPLLLFGVLKRLDTKRKEVENIFRFVGEIDILISIASLRKGLDAYCIPQIDESKISAKRVYHPLIVNCVTNCIDMSDKSILLTGSNMSGKTSFIRTIGLNMLTGMTINTCFAESMTMPKLKLFTAIRISDDLMNDKSYYFEEVLIIKEMIENSSKEIGSMFLLDEIFKGTNTVERISAGKAVLSMLSKKNNKVCVSTHDIELPDMLTDEYELYHFSEMVKDNNVDFDYKLKEGKLKNRNAIRILQINDYPSELIDEAISISKELDKTITTNH